MSCACKCKTLSSSPNINPLLLKKEWEPGACGSQLATWEARIGRTEIQGQPGQTVRKTLMSKIARAKWIGGVAREAEHLHASVKP
jgi:hypothetical protein